MKRVVLGVFVTSIILSFQNCAEPKLAFDFADHASALGVELTLVPDDKNIHEVDSNQKYTVEIELPEKGEIVGETIRINGVVHTYKKDALGNLNFDFIPKTPATYAIEAEVFTPSGKRFDVSGSLVIKDDYPPIVTITPAPSNTYKLSSTNNFSFTAHDVGGGSIASVICYLNADVKPCTYDSRSGTGSISFVDLEGGSYNLTVRAIDTYKNFGQKVVPFDMEVDATAPSITILPVAGNTGFSIDEQKFTVTVEDFGTGVATVDCTIDSVSTPHCPPNTGAVSHPVSFTFTAADNKVFTYTVVAVDNEGNSKTVQYSISILVDKVAPIVTLTKNSLNTNLVNQLQKVAFKVQDAGSGIVGSTLKCKVASAVVPCSIDTNGVGEITYTPTAQGAIKFEVEIKDRYANLGMGSLILDIIKDPSSPIITLTGNASNPAVPVISQTLKFDFTVTKESSIAPITSVVCKVEAAVVPCNATSTFTGTFSGSFATGGEKQVTVEAKDSTGNVSVKTYTVVIKVPGETSTPLVVASSKLLDIIIVIDNSGSMSEEQKNMADRISSFTDKLTEYDNWRVAVVTTDITSGRGNFLQIAGAPAGTKWVEKDSTDAQQRIGATVQSAGIAGDATEQGIAATSMAIDARVNNNINFFRANAALVVIVISDENESKNLAINKPENLIAQVQSVWPGKAFQFNSIVKNTSACSGVTLGQAYMNLSNLTGAALPNGSVIGCVGDKDYASVLSRVGTAAAALHKNSTLTCAPFNGSVVVQEKVGASYVSKTVPYTLAGNVINFTDGLPTGDYQLVYQCIK